MRSGGESSGFFGRGGDRRVRAKMVFSGHFTPNFQPYLVKKSDQLKLDTSVSVTPTIATVTSTGPEALVGALEMAACIGTEADAIESWTIEVTEIETEEPTRVRPIE